MPKDNQRKTLHPELSKNVDGSRRKLLTALVTGVAFAAPLMASLTKDGLRFATAAAGPSKKKATKKRPVKKRPVRKRPVKKRPVKKRPVRKKKSRKEKIATKYAKIEGRTECAGPLFVR